MFSINYSAYHHADHPRVRRIANELTDLIRPFLVNGQIPTSGELPDDLAKQAEKLFSELDALMAHNKRGN
jgi:hypothetical protein